jgi:hypothetical protein
MTQTPFLALITPLSGSGGGSGPVDPGYSPPWARPQPPRPNQDLPGQQPGIWGPGFPYPDQGLPGHQPYPDQGLPGFQPRPDQGLPGFQPRPDQGLPGNQPYPDQGLPGQGGGPPLVIWGPNDPRPGWGLPDLPEEITPPPAQGGDGEPVPVEWKAGWTQQHGWVVVGIPTGPVPTPSK